MLACITARLTAFLSVIIVAGILEVSPVGAARPRDAEAEKTIPPSKVESAPRVVHGPMMVEIVDLVTREREECQRLHRAFLAATDEDLALALQREIEATKRATEISILEVQLRYARKEGRPQTVEALSQALQRLRDRQEPADLADPRSED